MKRKILLILLLIFPFFINACSCDKFDIETYNSAVRNYKNSTGIDYNLTVTTYTEGYNKYILEESSVKYIFNTTKEVLDFSSQLKKYEVITNQHVANSAPQKVYELNRYYKGSEGKFYTNEIALNNDFKQVEQTNYESKYTKEDADHTDNIVPVFDGADITEFSIVKDKANKGYSIATFKAACPSVLTCDNELVSYTVTMDKGFYFTKIEFTIVNGSKTINYKYEFNKYNSDVKITFPNDLVNY